MEILNTIFYFIVTIGVLVFVHEFGHFIAAKLTGMRVDRFSIGFPPRAFGKRIGDTDYCISWIPIGGYVKIAGMIDESFDTEFLKTEPQPWEFRAKPLWARMLVITAGVAMNILLAIAIFWAINFAQGKYLRDTTEIGYVAPASAAEKAGLRSGDKVLRINGGVITHWDEVQSSIYTEYPRQTIALDIDRSGVPLTIAVPSGNLPDASSEGLGIFPAHTVAVIGSVEPGKPADSLGLKPRDVLVSLNGSRVFNQSQVVQIIRASARRTVKVVWKRGDETLEGTTTPNEEGRIGVTVVGLYTGPTRHVEFSLFEALPEGIEDIVKATGLFYASIVQLVTGKVSFSQSFGGPIKIAQIATQSAESGLTSYLYFMAILSISLALLNIVPFPALDGGHLMVMVIEAILRREMPHRVKLLIQQTGFVILIAFMAFVIYNDIMNF